MDFNVRVNVGIDRKAKKTFDKLFTLKQVGQRKRENRDDKQVDGIFSDNLPIFRIDSDEALGAE